MTLIDELLKELPKEKDEIVEYEEDGVTRYADVENIEEVHGWNECLRAVRELLEGKREK